MCSINFKDLSGMRASLLMTTTLMSVAPSAACSAVSPNVLCSRAHFLSGARFPSSRRCAKSSRMAHVTTNFAPASGDFSFSVPEGATAGAIVLGTRIFFVGIAKIGIGRNIDKYLAKCEAYGITTDDLYHVEDQPGDAWYLVGDWKPAKKGDPKHSDTTMVGILTTRAKTHELVMECQEKGVDVSDVVCAEYVQDFIKNEKKRWVEIRARLDAAAK